MEPYKFKEPWFSPQTVKINFKATRSYFKAMMLVKIELHNEMAFTTGQYGIEDDRSDSETVATRNLRAKRRSSAMAAAVAAAAALYGDNEPFELAPVELRAEILDSVLLKAARDALEAIPSQICVIFTYDRQANLLYPHLVVSGGDTSATVELQSLQEDAAQQPAEHNDIVPFPPTIGMIGACFLQKRCLRMQEPHRHRAFHREYDVPKGILVDSIICAPVIIRHRAIAVIQLLNRLNPDCIEDSFVESVAKSPTKAQDTSGDDFRDIALHRYSSHSLRLGDKKGFSSKDEQKFIQFASHLSQAAETRLKRVDDQSVTHTRIRELQANNAIDLLNILNARLERRDDNDDAVVPIGGFIHDRSSQLPLRSIVPKALDIPIDLIGALIAIIRLQARFRARRARRNERYAEALETFRRQHERVRSVVVLQRVARGVIVRKQVKRQKGAVAVLSRVYNHYRARLSYEASRDANKKPCRPTVTNPNHTSLETPTKSFKRRLAVLHESELVVIRRKSATVIQSQFRGHQTRKAIKQMTGFTNLAKGLRNIVKLQSVVRGGLVRIQVKRAKALLQTHSMQSPRTVCMRIGMSPGSPETRPAVAISTSSCCVYRLPESRNNAHVVHYRSLIPRSPRNFDGTRANALGNPNVQRIVQVHTRAGNFPSPNLFELESRRLTPTIDTRQHKSTSNVNEQISAQLIAKPFPGLVWELPVRKRTPRPPGVEFSSDHSMAAVRRRLSCIQRYQRTSVDGGRNNESQRTLARFCNNEFRTECTSPRDRHPKHCAGNATCGSGSKSDRLLESSNRLRREAVCSSMGFHSVLPLLDRAKNKKLSSRGGEPLLCCFLPAQPKPGGAYHRVVNQRRSSVESVGVFRSSSIYVAPVQPFDSSAVPQPTEDRFE